MVHRSWKRAGFTFLGLLFLVLLFFSSSAWACSCGSPPSPAEAFKISPAVFIGKVTEVREITSSSEKAKEKLGIFGDSYFQYQIKVEKAWKGVTKNKITMIHDVGFPCGFGSIKLGDRLLFYVGNTAQGFYDGPGSPFCTRNKHADAALVEALILDAVVAQEDLSTVYNKLPDMVRHHPDPSYRSVAALYLGFETPDPLPKDTLPALLAGLKDSDPQVRGNVAMAFTKNKFAKHRELLAPVLEAAFSREVALYKKAADPAPHEYAIRKLSRRLVEYGSRAARRRTVPHFIRDLKSDVYMVQFDAIQNLKKIGPDAQAAVPALKKLVTEDNYSTRDYALAALKAIQPQNSIDELIQALNHNDCRMVSTAVKGLNEIDSPRTRKVLKEKGVPRLVAKLNNSSCITSERYTLNELDVSLSPYVLQFLDILKMLEDRGKNDLITNMYRESVIEVLGNIGPKARAAIPFLKQLSLNDPSLKVRSAAVRALEEIEGKSFSQEKVSGWIQSLSDASPAIRNHAARKLIEADTPEGWTAIEQSLVPKLIEEWNQRGNHMTRTHNTLSTLAAISSHAEGALPIFKEVLDGDDEILRRYALSGLKKMDKASVEPLLPKLKALLKDSQNNNGQSRGYIVEILGIIGTPEAKAAIQEYTQWFVPELFKDLNSKDLRRQDNFWHINTLLPYIDNPVPRIVDNLESGEGKVRTKLLRVLRALGKSAREATPRLIALFKDQMATDKKDWQAIVKAVDEIQALGPEHTETAQKRVLLLEILKRPELMARMYWINTFEAIGTPEAKKTAEHYRKRVLPHLEKVITCDYKKARKQGVALLGKLAKGSPVALRLLIAGLSDKAGKVRRESALALRDLGADAAPAVLALTNLLNDEYPWARRIARIALKTIGTKEALQALQ